MEPYHRPPWALLGAFFFVGLTFATALVHTLYQEPLLPFQSGSLRWCQFWLGTTVGDYYVLSFGVSTIIWHTEDRASLAVLWILLINLLGSPFWMAYLFYRCHVHGATGVQLKGSETSCPLMGPERESPLEEDAGRRR
jgi:hypothetical protein